MKVQFSESDLYAEVNLIPETVEETAQLMRMAKNYRKRPVVIRYYFYKNPRCEIFIRKILETNQNNSIYR